ncbi:uncharacterized protein LOC120846929 [Ixodes scapularis]|uniref:uncharacterized protein LOC120846929 n=1 Tax=Ixodes scapularis TaxID=6945 RepID=UPI001AD70AAD|nr:uncharacterized protein LOC120846929 [Ixodes scapularis]
MDNCKKRDFTVRKFRSKYKFQGRRRKLKRRTPTAQSLPLPDRPNPSNDGCSGGSEEIDPVDAAFTFVSASEKKIGFFENEERRSGDGSASAVVCDIGALTTLVSGVTCPACHEGKLSVRESAEKRKGLASFLELHCENSECPESVLSSTFTSKRVTPSGAESANGRHDSGSSRDGFAVNVKAVVATRAIGAGHEQLSRFCAILGLPKPMHHKTFNSIGKKVHYAAMTAASQNLEKARLLTKEEVGGADVAVMFDGTWQKRGHKSHNGVGTAVSVDTGLCLDFEVLSNYCLTCSRHQDLGEEEEAWQAFHSVDCQRNVECSSHAMETEAAVRIWQRTPSYKTPLRFTKFLSDGDSKAFTAVSEADVYDGAAIEKEDCTNHVAKRLGTGLRKLKTPLPRGEKLKDGTIQKLQTYYQIAVISNRADIRGMYCAIWATYFHSCSTNTAHSHKFCPEGATSWCKHKRAEALGEPAPDHTPTLTKAQGKAVLPIYRRLTDEKLLARCIRGKTQNAAESLNSKIWLLCPKTRFASRTVVETATAIAVLWFNGGHASFEHVLEELGVLPPKGLLTLGDSRDDLRIRRMSARQTAEARAHRRSMVTKARLEDSSRKDHEGTTYSAGDF